jgi:hypothetical protein
VTTTLNAEGLLEFPEEIRRIDESLKPGQRFEIERVGPGDFRMRVVTGEAGAGKSWLDWLRECPEKNWMKEPDRSEMTSLEPPALFSE